MLQKRKPRQKAKNIRERRQEKETKGTINQEKVTKLKKTRGKGKRKKKNRIKQKHRGKHNKKEENGKRKQKQQRKKRKQLTTKQKKKKRKQNYKHINSLLFTHSCLLNTAAQPEGEGRDGGRNQETENKTLIIKNQLPNSKVCIKGIEP